MPGSATDSGTADALAFGRKFEHHINAGLARIGMIAGEHIDSVSPGGRTSDTIRFAALGGFGGGDVATMIDASRVSRGSSSEC
jgi:hypothetical protein